ncbi:hypothetical protein XI02_14005 [Bradyrhizobium sp. CCBAU 21365]|nr:hypothetical protein XI02_14005 [Bradyrhizobium sp. CCBAU 21365]
MQALRAALIMAKADQGAFGVTFLRPAYEELVWVEYLTAHKAIASELVRLLGAHEIAANLDTQNQFIGAKGMLNVGFTQSFVKRRLAATRESDVRLRALGRKLGWRDGQMSPSLAFLARKIGREKEYNFIYHATSRFVHFSTVETFRRVWGNSGQVTISTENFSRYGTDFSLYWGLRVFVETVSAAQISDFADRRTNDGVGEEILQLVEGLHPVEIVTAAELESWPSRREYGKKQ